MMWRGIPYDWRNGRGTGPLPCGLQCPDRAQDAIDHVDECPTCRHVVHVDVAQRLAAARPYGGGSSE